MEMAPKKYAWLYFVIPPIILAAVTALFYYPSLHYDFQFDDIANITKHFDIRYNGLSTVWFSGTRWISYWLNAFHFSIGRFDPFSYRVGNLIIHILNGLLVFFVLLIGLSGLKSENFFKRYAIALSTVTSLFFLLHPVQTQTVSYVIQGELEGLAAFFILSMALCLMLYAKANQKIVKGLLLLLLYCLAIISCGTKEIAVISPLLLLLIDWFFIAQGQWHDLKKRIWLHGTLATLIFTIYVWFLKPTFFTKIVTLNSVAKNNIGNVITHDPTQAITPWSFFISQFKVIIHYLWIFIWPFNISVEYDDKLARHLFAPDSIFPLLALLLIGYLVIRQLKKNQASLIGFGALWFAFCMAPRSSIIPSPELLVDYKTYLASFGWLFLIATFLVFLFNRITQLLQAHASYKKTISSYACICLLGLSLGFASWQRNKIWRSGLEFWSNIIKNAPGKARAYNNYGVELSQKLARFKEAIPYFQKAIAMDSKYPDPCNNLAVAYSQLGKVDEAIHAIKLGLKINPYHPEGYNNLASFFITKKEYAHAEKSLEVALRLRPHYGKAFFNMGRMYLEKGEQEKAWEYFKAACTKADLDTDIGFATFGRVSLSLKKYDEALWAFKKTIELNPSYPEALFNLATVYSLMDKPMQAIELYQRALAQNPNELRAYYNLGETYLKLNQADKAFSYFKRVAHMRAQLPTVGLRTAACYEKMGKLKEARQEILKTINDTAVPEQVRSAATTLLAHFEKQYAKHALA